MGGAVEVDAINERCLFFHVGSQKRSRRVRGESRFRRLATKWTDVRSNQIEKTRFKSLQQHAVQKLRETVGPVDVIFEESCTAESQ